MRSDTIITTVSTGAGWVGWGKKIIVSYRIYYEYNDCKIKLNPNAWGKGSPQRMIGLNVVFSRRPLDRLFSRHLAMVRLICREVAWSWTSCKTASGGRVSSVYGELHITYSPAASLGRLFLSELTLFTFWQCRLISNNVLLRLVPTHKEKRQALFDTFQL